jgi:hypothetical protein
LKTLNNAFLPCHVNKKIVTVNYAHAQNNS